MKRISTEAYQALRHALPVIHWYKKPFETFLRTALREHPSLLAGLNFADTKRIVADNLVDRLVEHEDPYQEATLNLMLEVAGIESFPDLERLAEPERTEKLGTARSAVAQMKKATTAFAEDVANRQRSEAARQAEHAQQAASRKFASDLDGLKQTFMQLQKEDDTRRRGYALEKLLNDLWWLYDLEPRFSYSTELEQIDGSFSFDTDDYIVESRWRVKPASRADGDVFTAKVRSKGKNAVGLFVSIAGFTSDFVARFNEGTSFITIDGHDLMLILDDRIRLDEALKAKKRFANDTGSCHLPLAQYLQS